MFRMFADRKRRAKRISTLVGGLIAMNFALFGRAALAEHDQPAATDDIRVQADIVYARDGSTEQKCDVYFPREQRPGKTTPAVLVIHGGAWSTGSKRLMAGYATQLAEAGTVAVAINYHLAPHSKFPTQLDDVRDALIWLNDHAKKFSIDTDRLGIFGYSAGGHLACMVATLQDESTDRLKATSNWSVDDPRWRRLPRVAAVVAGGPPCEFRNLPLNNSGLSYFLGGTRADLPETYEAASPCAFASDGDCPIAFIHGERDLIVPIRSSQSLYDAQRAVGVQSEFVMIEKQGHMIAFLHPKTGEALVDYMRRKLLLDVTR